MVASGDDSGDADELWGDDLMAAIMGRVLGSGRMEGRGRGGKLEGDGVRLMNGRLGVCRRAEVRIWESRARPCCVG